MSAEDSPHGHPATDTDAAENAFPEQTPSYYCDPLSPHANGATARPHSRDLEPPYRAMRSHDMVVLPPCHHAFTTPSGLTATLLLDNDTVEIYDRSTDAFQYSLKGSVNLDWTNDSELLLRDARIDFMGYADTAVLRYEAGAGGIPLTTEAPVHHTHDFVATPMVLGNPSSSRPSSSRETTFTTLPPEATIAGDSIDTTGSDSTPESESATAATAATSRHHDSLPIDLTLPGHLPDSTNLQIGKIRYELQVSLEVTFAQGTSDSVSEQFILRRPVLIHRIVYPSSQLLPRMVQGLDSGGVDIQIKVPRLLHCENTLLVVELYAKPRSRNVRLRKAKVVFEQIETDRYQRSPSVLNVPKAVVPLATSAHPHPNHPLSQHPAHHSSSATSPPPFRHSPLPLPPPAAGPPPPPRLLTRAIAQPLELEFEEPTKEMETQNLNLQLVLSPALCVDVQSSWLQISHTLRVEIEYTTDDDESYVTAPPLEILDAEEMDSELVLRRGEGEHGHYSEAKEVQRNDNEEDNGASGLDSKEAGSTEWEQVDDVDEVTEGQVIADHADTHTSADVCGAEEEIDWSKFGADEKTSLPDDQDTGPSGAHNAASNNNNNTHQPSSDERDGDADPSLLPNGLPDSSLAVPSRSTAAESTAVAAAAAAAGTKRTTTTGSLTRPSTSNTPQTSSSYTNSLATEEISVRVVRVVSTALVDASTLAQAAGETEAGLPTYESVIEATGLPAYAEEKVEDDQEGEASGTVTGVLGGAARRLEGEDAEVERH